MHLPFLSVYDDGDGIVRLRINFLQEDTDPTLPSLNARLANAFKFFGNDMVRTGAIGEFIVEPFLLRPDLHERRRPIAQAGWRAEVHSLTSTDFQSEIQAFEAANAVAPITDLRWVVAHVPQITADYVQRLKALGGGVNLTGWQYLAGGRPASRPAVPDDRGQRHPDGHELGRHADRADEPVDPLLLRGHRHQRPRQPDQPGPAAHPPRGDPALHPGQRLVPRRRGRARSSARSRWAGWATSSCSTDDYFTVPVEQLKKRCGRC